MKKLLVVLMLVLAYTFSYAEDYQPDQLGKNYDVAAVEFTATVIAPIELGFNGAEGLNDVIAGTKRTWTNVAPDLGPSALLEIETTAGYSYAVTFVNQYSQGNLIVKGKWYELDETTQLISPASFSNPTNLEFIIDEVDATAVVAGAYTVTLNVSVVYTSI